MTALVCCMYKSLNLFSVIALNEKKYERVSTRTAHIVCSDSRRTAATRCLQAYTGRALSTTMRSKDESLHSSTCIPHQASSDNIMPGTRQTQAHNNEHSKKKNRINKMETNTFKTFTHEKVVINLESKKKIINRNMITCVVKPSGKNILLPQYRLEWL